MEVSDLTIFPELSHRTSVRVTGEWAIGGSLIDLGNPKQGRE
jgi:hypothetical protein